MISLLLLIPAALFLGLLGLVAFIWSVKTGQFDDLDGAAERILLDEDGLDKPFPRKCGRSGNLRSADRQVPVLSGK